MVPVLHPGDVYCEEVARATELSHTKWATFGKRVVIFSGLGRFRGKVTCSTANDAPRPAGAALGTPPSRGYFPQ